MNYWNEKWFLFIYLFFQYQYQQVCLNKLSEIIKMSVVSAKLQLIFSKLIW